MACLETYYPNSEPATYWPGPGVVLVG